MNSNDKIAIALVAFFVAVISLVVIGIRADNRALKERVQLETTSECNAILKYVPTYKDSLEAVIDFPKCKPFIERK